MKLALFVATMLAALATAVVHSGDIPVVAFSVFMLEVSGVWTIYTLAERKRAR